MASFDPVKCKCKTNACTRIRGREGNNTRGFCPCRQNGTPCTYLCGCGTGKYGCANQEYVEEEEDYREDADGIEDLHDPLYELHAEQRLEQVVEVVETEAAQSTHRSTKETSDATAVVVQGINVTKREKKSSEIAEIDEAMEVEPTQDKSGKASHKKKSAAGAQGMNMTKRNKKSSEVQRKSDADFVKSQITELTTDGIKDLVLKLADLYPDLVNMAMGPNPPEPPPHTGPDGWCKCYRCRQMPTVIERQCCISSDKERCILLTSGGPINQLVLSRTALEVAVLNHNEYCIQNDDPNDNNTLRHMAYRKYILWSRGYLGAGVRVVIPSCVVWAIRDKYPSANGTYTGYKPPHN